jgi:ribonucleotide reductase alpha subunit
VSPAAVTGYVVAKHPVFKEALQAEKRTIVTEIVRRFQVRPQSAEGVKFMRFTLEPRDE